jgi:hypothetical protein
MLPLPKMCISFKWTKKFKISPERNFYMAVKVEKGFINKQATLILQEKIEWDWGKDQLHLIQKPSTTCSIMNFPDLLG